ncbi:MAG: hypothetical protein R2694_09670 [Ilumatobacteraceae bacterium]
MNPDELAELEEERGSRWPASAHLDREHEADDVDDADYTTLRDGYVACRRGALREIEDGKRHLPPSGLPARGGGAWCCLVGVLAVGVLLGPPWPSTLGSACPGRASPGQTPTPCPLRPARPARHWADRRPDECRGEVQARAGAGSQQPGGLVTYGSWLQVLVGSQGSDAELDGHRRRRVGGGGGGRPHVRRPVCPLAVARGRFLSLADADGAKEAGERCLAADPPADMVPMIQGMLDSL